MIEERIKQLDVRKAVKDAGYKGRHIHRDFKKILDAARMVEYVLAGAGIEILLRESQPAGEKKK